MRNISDIMNENQYEEEKKKHRAFTAKELGELGITLLEDEFSTAKEVVIRFIQMYLMDWKPGVMSSCYYCGITDDMVTRKKGHESEDYSGHSISKVYLIKCKDVDMADEVEEKMRDLGFDTGETDTPKNGAADDTDFVYFYRKPNCK